MIEIEGFEKYLISRNGQVVNKTTGKILRPDENNCGYLRITLCKDGKAYRFFVHHLVARHYIPNPNMCKQVNHKDGNKKNNQDTNLEWVTPSRNILHAFEIGLKGIGEKHHSSIVSNDTVEKVCQMISDGSVRGDIMKTLGVSRYLIDDVRRRKTWTHISKNYIW
jgi:hypothetical protein